MCWAQRIAPVTCDRPCYRSTFAVDPPTLTLRPLTGAGSFPDQKPTRAWRDVNGSSAPHARTRFAGGSLLMRPGSADPRKVTDRSTWIDPLRRLDDAPGVDAVVPVEVAHSSGLTEVLNAKAAGPVTKHGAEP